MKARLNPGQRHPRIWRGSYLSPSSGELAALTSAITSANIIFERFRRVLQVIEPDPSNRLSFGHEPRQLLILSCTEVESAWRSILFRRRSDSVW